MCISNDFLVPADALGLGPEATFFVFKINLFIYFWLHWVFVVGS